MDWEFDDDPADEAEYEDLMEILAMFDLEESENDETSTTL